MCSRSWLRKATNSDTLRSHALHTERTALPNRMLSSEWIVLRMLPPEWLEQKIGVSGIDRAGWEKCGSRNNLNGLASERSLNSKSCYFTVQTFCIIIEKSPLQGTSSCSTPRSSHIEYLTIHRTPLVFSLQLTKWTWLLSIFSLAVRKCSKIAALTVWYDWSP